MTVVKGALISKSAWDARSNMFGCHMVPGMSVVVGFGLSGYAIWPLGTSGYVVWPVAGYPGVRDAS